MQPKRRLLLLVALVSIFGLTLASVAQSRQVAELPDYGPEGALRLFFHPDLPVNYQLEEGQPFWFGGGVGDQAPGYAIKDYRILLFMDGAQVEPTYVGCTGDPALIEPNQRCSNFIYDFPDGLPAGDYEFYIAYMAPCGVWLDGFGEDWTVSSCVDDKVYFPHPELAGFKWLTVTESTP